MNHKVTIIIANYNGEKYLFDCLKSLNITNYKNFNVCIVDDGSNDGSLEIINNFDSFYEIDLLHQTHGGASKARNKAIEKYRDISDVLVFLDNDTEVTPLWLDEILLTLYSDILVGAVQSTLIDFQRRDIIQSAGIKLIPHTCWGVSLNQGKLFKETPLLDIEIACISACMAVKTEIFKFVDPFDEYLAVSTEDLDFAWRIWISGFKIKLSSKSIVYHYTKSIEMRKDMNIDNYQQYFHITKNTFRTLIKNYSFFNLVYFFPQAFFINLARAVLVLYRRNDSSSLSAFLTAFYWNIKVLNNTLFERRQIQSRRKDSDKNLYDKIMLNESLYEIYKKYFSQTNLL